MPFSPHSLPSTISLGRACSWGLCEFSMPVPCSVLMKCRKCPQDLEQGKGGWECSREGSHPARKPAAACRRWWSMRQAERGRKMGCCAWPAGPGRPGLLWMPPAKQWITIQWYIFFPPQNALFFHNRFSTDFFSMKMAEFWKMVLVSFIIDFDDSELCLRQFCLNLNSFAWISISAKLWQSSSNFGLRKSGRLS